MTDGVPLRARIRLWGVRGTCPSPGAHTVRYGGNTPCVEVRSTEGDVVVLDAGTGLRAFGQSIRDETDARPVHLFLSHRHSDHIIGLPHFAPLISGTRNVLLSCALVDSDELQLLASSLLSPPMFPSLPDVPQRVAVREWNAAKGAKVGERWSVRALPARHPGGASVIVIEDELGAVLAYAPDNELSMGSSVVSVVAWRHALARSLRNVPVLVHDATYIESELAAHTGWGHSSAEEATRFAVECNAGSLLLFHHHPDRCDDMVAQIATRCRELARSLSSPLTVDAAAEGQITDVRLPESQLASALA